MCKAIPLIFLFCLCGCANNPVCVIEGILPGRQSYEDEWVYLVPMENATIETVDSCKIKKGSFRFERPTGSSGIFVLRTRPILRLTLQELLVVVEPGHLEVKLDTVSSARGTSANNALQQWKERKTLTDKEYGNLNRILRICDDSIQRRDIRTRIEQLRKEFSAYNYTFVKENEGNAAGKFVYRLIEPSLSEEQLDKLQIR